MIEIDLRIVCAAQVKDQQSGTVYAFFHPRDHRQQQFLSFGTLDTTSGALEVLNKWTDPTLLFVINSLCTVDSESAQFYAGTRTRHSGCWFSRSGLTSMRCTRCKQWLVMAVVLIQWRW